MGERDGFGGKPDRRVLILGGGFGGIYTALGLEKQLKPEDRTEVTLVNAENFFLFTPLLAEVASSSIDTSHAINPIRRMFKRTRFVEGEVVGLDPDKRTVTVRHPGDTEYDYPYDQLVVALGARQGYFGMKDVQEHSLTVKTLGDAIHLRNWAIQMLETADVERDSVRRAELLTFVVAGGNLTGVEVCGELNDLVRQAAGSYPTISQRDIRVILVEAANRLVPALDENLSRFTLQRLRALGVEVMLTSRVDGASEREVRIKGQEPIPTRTLVWATGVAPNPFVQDSPLPKDEKGWVTVDAHLRVPGLPGVWALGDCARVPDVLNPGKFQTSAAQQAIREGHHLARNIATYLRGGAPTEFRYRSLGQMATLGRFNGVGLIGPVPVSGFVAWAIWRTYYLYRLPRLEKQLRVMVDWTADLVFGRDISQIQTYVSNVAGDEHQHDSGARHPQSSQPPDAVGAGSSGGADSKWGD